MAEFVLTLPDQKKAFDCIRGKCSSGQEEVLRELSKTPLARSELGQPKGRDHIHLSRFDNSDYVQWWGRCADGYHRPIGRIMQMVPVSSQENHHD